MHSGERLSQTNTGAIQKLTALWALSESGLGGIMFALKIPMTGFFVGGFAVILISLIAWFSNRDYKQIIQATILVIMVKAMVSPHSPLPAYFAVAFQGFFGALVFRAVRSYKIACILLGMFAMVESAGQKIIVLTLIFGKGIWEAVNGLFSEISKNFSLHVHVSYAVLVIIVYLFLYAVWGFVIGTWAAKIPAQTEAKKQDALAAYESIKGTNEIPTQQQKKSKKIKRFFFFFITLLFITAVFIWSGANSRQVLFILLRSIAAILLLFFILGPVIKYAISKWLQKQSGERKQQAAELISMLPQMRSFVSPAYRLANKERSPFKKLRYFILYMIIFALYVQ